MKLLLLSYIFAFGNACSNVTDNTNVLERAFGPVITAKLEDTSEDIKASFQSGLTQQNGHLEASLRGILNETKEEFQQIINSKFEEQDEKNYDSDRDDEKNHSEYDEADNLYAKIDELKESRPSRNIASPQTTVSPRKINIGPPKPPRSFNHPTTSETETEEKSAKKGLKSRISEGNLFRRSPRGDEKGSAVPDSASEGSENIYVTAPVWSIADAVSDNCSDALSGESDICAYTNCFLNC